MAGDALPHLPLQSGEQVEFRNPVQGRDGPRRIPARDRVRHARSLAAQLQAVESGFAQPEARAPGAQGHLVTATVEPESDLRAQSLNDGRRGVALVAVTEDHAIVHVREDDVRTLRRKIEEYGTQDTRAGKPKNEPLVAPIRELRATTLADLSNGWLSAHSIDVGQTYVVELWAYGGRLAPEEIHDRVGSELRWLLEVHGGDADALRRFRGTERDIYAAGFPGSALLDLPKAVPDVYRVLPLSGVVRDLYVAESAPELVAELDVESPDEASSVVAIIDTGITEAHPMLAPAMRAAGTSVVVGDESAADPYGHGTAMAGLAAYEDVVESLAAGSTRPRNWLENVRILRHAQNGDEDREFWPERTEQAFEAAEANGPARRVFNLSFGADNPLAVPRTSWSVGLDILAHNDAVARLVCVAAGTLEPSAIREEYPAQNLASPLDDPAQAVNVLTVGAYTTKVDLPDDQLHRHLTPIAAEGCLSPYSQTDVGGGRRPIKPDVLWEGGNTAPDGVIANKSIETLTPWSTSREFATRSPIEPVPGTSPACASVSGLAGAIWAQNPTRNATTIRALVVHSARWTSGLVAQFPNSVDLLRAAGYGVPDADRAAVSWRPRPTMVLEDTMPLPRGRDERPVVHYVGLPLPVAVLQDLGDLVVEISVCLAFTIEPNETDAQVYPGAMLKWDLQRALESDRAFHQRINMMERAPDYVSTGQHLPWEIGPIRRGRGSVQADRCRLTAAELADVGHVAIWPVLGWWRNRRERLGFSVPYSLVVTIDAGEADVDLYTPIEVQLSVPVDAS
jgi:hypothetical protein